MAPSTPTYPGVYVEEIPSTVRAIAGVSTSITAFIGAATRGPTNQPITVQSFSDYEKKFGGLSQASTMSYAVYQFFLNGGSEAVIVRVADVQNGAKKATAKLGDTIIQATGEGLYGDELKIRVDHDTSAANDQQKKELFNLFVHDSATGITESFRNVSIVKTSPRYVVSVVAEGSQLIEFAEKDPSVQQPPAKPSVDVGDNPFSPDREKYYDKLGKGSDGKNPFQDSDIATGLRSLERSFFNLLCIPPVDRVNSTPAATYVLAAKLCKDKRAVLIIDPSADPSTVEGAIKQMESIAKMDTLAKEHSAFYFPRFKASDPQLENRLATFVPCGAVAGMIARTDATRGVWKSPGGTEAGLTGAVELDVELTDQEQGRLNPLGVNCLRNFPDYGNVVWGVRTANGSDAQASQWKYLAVRRTALFIEESLYRGTKWVVMEPNAKPTWDAIELNISNFLHRLFRQGAFQGETPEKAYFVKCDEETTSQADIDLGIVNIQVGFAPLKPAEFVIIKIQQIVETGEQ